jgi:transketolase
LPTSAQRANAIRALAMDAVERAASGHPGAPMGMADIAEVLWREVLKHDPADPRWPDRDRFVLSNGHGSMLLYALLHLAGYDLPLEELKKFRQLHSKTPGHPVFGETPGVETTTGPLGQGFANAVGMAIAEKVLAARYNRDSFPVVDHRTWVFVGDGCLMEGISHEAASLAGVLGLSKLICVYDDNGISIDGPVAGWLRDDTPARFRAYGWRVIAGVDGHDVDAIRAALAQALAPGDAPTLVCCRTVIGFGAPTKAGTASAHGSPLGAAEVAATRERLAWPHPPFEVPADIRAEWDCRPRGAAAHARWRQCRDAWRSAHPALAAEFERVQAGQLPDALAAAFDGLLASARVLPAAETRRASGSCLDAIGPLLPELLGGSADLTGSNITLWKGARVLGAAQADAQYIHYGVREFAMTAIGNGIALHGGLLPYTATFLTFLDYARNAVRLAALMRLRHVLVYTHDSLALGEDGPTHQPVEHLTSLRTTPNVSVWRPADAFETAVAWRAALQRSDGPTALVLSRQKLVTLPRDDDAAAAVARGGYVVRDVAAPHCVAIATGSEVALALAAADLLDARDIRLRVVSMPSTDVFLAQPAAYRDAVLPRGLRRVAVEAAHPDWWYRLVGLDGLVIGVDRFGVSAPGDTAMAHFGLRADAVCARIEAWSREAGAA